MVSSHLPSLMCISKSSYGLFYTYIFICACARSHDTSLLMRRSKDGLQESGFPFHPMCLWAWPPVFRLGRNHFHLVRQRISSRTCVLRVGLAVHVPVTSALERTWRFRECSQPDEEIVCFFHIFSEDRTAFWRGVGSVTLLIFSRAATCL